MIFNRVQLLLARMLLILFCLIMPTSCDLVPDAVKEQYLTQNEGKIRPLKLVWKKDQSKMKLIPSGSFQMGDANLYPEAMLGEEQSGEKPPRPVHTQLELVDRVLKCHGSRLVIITQLFL